MGDKVAGPPPEGTPPADFGAFPREVVTRLLKRAPDQLYDLRPQKPESWPDDKTDAEFIYRGFARRLNERGATSGAADSIRSDLENGRIPALVIDNRSGERHPIPQQLWAAADTSALMYWTGRAEVRDFPNGSWKGDIYLPTVPQPAASIQPAKAKPPDLTPREKDTVYRLILGLAVKGYGYKPPEPGKRSTVVPEIVADLAILGLNLSDETVRKWLADAYEALGKPDLS